jgi:hypothetical protein
MKFTTGIAVFLCLGVAARCQGDTLINLLSANGTVPGTSTTYTIIDNGAAQSVSPNVGNSNNHTWNWTTGFSEFSAAGGQQTLTVNFSAPISISQIVTGIRDAANTTTTFAVSGGSASTSDFNLTDGLFAQPAAIYNSITGLIVSSGANGTLMIGSTSSNTLTSFSLSTPTSGVGEGTYTQFFGLNAGAAATPEPGSIALLGSIALSGGLFAVRKLRRSR